ncbi:MAG: hypothetical protein ACLQIB_04015 [Isosphaeraceae bacterium]
MLYTANRAIGRLGFIVWLGILGLAGLPQGSAVAAAPPERVLPENTILLFKMNNAKEFRESFRQSQYGQLWNDSGLKEFKEELSQRINDASKSIRERIGMSIGEILAIPQGTVGIAAIYREEAKSPLSFVVLADAGENAKKMEDLLDRASKQSEESGAKVSTESFSGMTLHIIQPPPRKDPEPADKEKESAAPRPPIVWTNSGSDFFVGTDVEIVKDLVAHRDGRDNSLAATDAFSRTVAKINAGTAQATWFIDLAKVIKVAIKMNARGAEADAQQNEVLAQELGVLGKNGLKSVGGCITLGSGAYDSVTKTFFLAPRPVDGLLKIFSLPPISLRPESWVPATVASYQTISFDLDNAYKGLEDLVNKFQPGMINILEQQLVGPNGGPPLSLKNDVFGPIGDRITIISDFKKPIKEDSQRVLLAVHLEDAKAFQNTLNQILTLTGADPAKREFQGTTIYDFQVGNLANNPAAPDVNLQAIRGPISLAVAKDTFFVTTSTALLEQVLRPGNTTLADSNAYQAVAKEIPEKASGMNYVRPDEQARLSYDMVKTGQFEKVIQQAAAGARNGRELPSLDKLIPTDKLPEFALFAKYLSLGGGYSVMDEDGFVMTSFTLRRNNP